MPVPLIFVYKLLPGNDVKYQGAVFFESAISASTLALPPPVISRITDKAKSKRKYSMPSPF